MKMKMKMEMEMEMGERVHLGLGLRTLSQIPKAHSSPPTQSQSQKEHILTQV